MAFPILGNPKVYIPNDSGAPGVGYQFETRDPDTDVLKATYPTAEDADAGTNANANPVVLDARGEPTGFWGRDGESYKVVLKNSSGTTVWTVDNIPPGFNIDSSFTASYTSAVSRSLRSKLTEWISIEDFGCVGDDSTECATFLQNAVDWAEANDKFLYIPDGVFKISSTVLITTTRLVLSGNGKGTLKFYSGGNIQVGNSANNAQYTEIKDFKIQQDVSATLSPIRLINGLRPTIQDIEMVSLYRDGITIGSTTEGTAPAVVRILNVNTFGVAAGVRGIYIDIPTGVTSSIYVDENSRFNGFSGSTEPAIRATVAGTLDGFHINGAITSDHQEGLWVEVSAGGTLTNMKVDSCLIDQVDQLGVYVANSGTVGDVKITDNVINGTVDTATGTNGLVEMAGAGTWNSVVDISYNEFKNANRVAVKITSGIASGNFLIRSNWMHDFGRDGNAAGSAISYAGTMDSLVVTGNIFDTARTRDYDIRDDTSTITLFICHSNIGVGTAPTTSQTSGAKTYNKGSATIVGGNTSIAVTHGLASTPSVGDIQVTPIESLGSAGKFYVDALTSTQFTINVDVDPVSSVDFAWSADTREV